MLFQTLASGNCRFSERIVHCGELLMNYRSCLFPVLLLCSKEKTAVLAELINRTNVQEMRWIIMIILKG